MDLVSEINVYIIILDTFEIQIMSCHVVHSAILMQ